MNKKVLIISLVIFLGLSIAIQQYIKQFQSDFANATIVKPANGHLWAEMECNADGLCVSGSDSTQKVGIGTNAPTEKLEVNGKIKATDVCTVSGNCLSALATLTNACGGAATNYAYSATAFSGTYCAMGTPTPTTLSFPAAGSSTNWTCPVTNGSPISCTATHAPAPVIGVCGAAATTYPFSATAFSGAYCTTGTPSPTTSTFPAMGSSVSWSCLGSNGGASPSCTASRSNPAPLVNFAHTELECTTAGGTVVGTDVSYNQCRFNSGCPSGWTQYKSYSITAPATHYNVAYNGQSCGSCTTGSHASWSNVALESCQYPGLIWCTGWCCGGTVTGYASIVQIGCY